MKVITAIEDYRPQENDICVFLAGGITNCPNWQKEVINRLNENVNIETLCVFNPRRENFPIHDPNASLEQIAWEYKWLEHMDIFSMYFSSGESDQPICMYELGRNILRMQNRYPSDWEKRIIITAENGYKRKNDVIIQTGLATHDKVYVDTRITLNGMLTQEHADYIYKAYRNIEIKS